MFGLFLLFIGEMTFASFAVSIAISAVVGAAIGGIMAAVTGGDIGKGMLYGAVGGAVMGGLGEFASWASTSISGTGTGAVGSSTAGTGTLSTVDANIQAASDFAKAGPLQPSAAGSQTWSQKLAASFTSEEAVGKMAGGVLQGAGSAMGSIGAADTQADAMDKQSQDLMELQRLKGKQTLEEIGATGRETLARTREEIEGRHADTRIPFEERRIREENIARNLGMLTTGAPK